MIRKVFRAEIVKPVNMDWQGFNTVLNKAMFASARLGNEVMATSYLLAKKQVVREGSFCRMITSCREDDSTSFNVRCAVCRRARLRFQAMARELLRGDVRLPTFRNNSLYMRDRAVKLWPNADNGDWEARLAILPGHQLQPVVRLRMRTMRRRSPGYYQILERIASGEYKLGTVELVRNRQRGKLYLLMSYSFEPAGRTVDSDRVMAVYPDVTTLCSLDGREHEFPPRRVLEVKDQIERRRETIRREISGRSRRRGHGRKAKYASLTKLEDRWANFWRNWSHARAREVVDYAQRQGVSTIYVADTPEPGKDWPSYDLVQKIQNKCDEAKLRVVVVKDSKLSQACSQCGSLEGEAEDGTFRCGSCGYEDSVARNTVRVLINK